MNISTKGLKKIHQDDKKTVLQHPDGHQITIAHSKLKPEHAAALLKLPMHKHDSQPVQKFADGGTAQPEPTAGRSGTNSSAPYTPHSGGSSTSGSSNSISGAQISKPSTWFAKGGDVPATAADGGSDTDSTSDSDVGTLAASTQNSTPVADPAAPAPAAPTPGLVTADNADDGMSDYKSSAAAAPADASSPGGSDPLSNFGLQQGQPANNMVSPGMPATTGIDNAIKGYNTLAANQGKVDAAVQPQRDQNAQQMQQLSDTFQSHMGELQKESQDAYAAFQSGHIDPDHYMKSLSTGGRVATAIGLILGGIGGGMTHQANPALEFLNKQIDRDIDGQKANLGKQSTLFSMLKEKMGSEIAGTAAAKGMMTDALISKIQAEAAKNGSSDAQAKAQIAIAPLQMQKDQYMQQAAMMKTAHDTLTSGNMNPAVQGQATRMYLNAAGAKPEQVDKAEGELAEVQGLNKVQENMQTSFAQLRSKVGAGILTPGDSDALRQTYGQQLQVQLEHRYNHDAAEQMVKNMFPRPGDTGHTLEDKLKVMGNVFDAARAKATPTINSFGIPVPKPKPIGTKVNTVK